MKTNFMKHAFVFAIITVVIAACSKYEDGPAFSLKSKKSRLCGEWVLEAYLYNDVDQTASMDTILGADYVLEIEKDNTYRTEGQWQDQGTWELGADGDDV